MNATTRQWSPRSFAPGWPQAIEYELGTLAGIPVAELLESRARKYRELGG